MLKRLTNKQLLKIWKARLQRRTKTLQRLKAAIKPNGKRIGRAEYRVLIARLKVNKYKKLTSDLAIRPPVLAVDRAEQGNVHGSLNPRVILLHSTESHDRPGSSDVKGILTFLEGHPESLGIHYVIDKEGNVGRGARHHQMVYHARGANSFSIGIEQVGFAHSTEWKRHDRLQQLETVAKTLAYISAVERIPLKHSVSHGVAMHRDFPAGGHTDPGVPKAEYPFHYVLRLAQRYQKEGW